MERAIENEIAATMSKRLDCIAALVKLAEQQRDILMTSRHEDLAGNLAAHDPLLVEIKQLEKREETLRAQLPDADQAATTFDSRLRVAIAAQAEKLYAITTTNKQLMIRQMEFVNFTLGMIFRTATDTFVTGAGNNPALVIDSRA
jgi:hypothetical protein